LPGSSKAESLFVEGNFLPAGTLFIEATQKRKAAVLYGTAA
jgi:hypothetical protein